MTPGPTALNRTFLASYVPPSFSADDLAPDNTSLPPIETPWPSMVLSRPSREKKSQSLRHINDIICTRLTSINFNRWICPGPCVCWICYQHRLLANVAGEGCGSIVAIQPLMNVIDKADGPA